MKQFGLKLWSKDFIKNKEFALSAEKALKEGKFDYLELFALPDSYQDTFQAVRQAFSGVKTVIHAPHNIQHLNISNPDEFENNRHRLKDSQLFADLLQADFIILHPGMNNGAQFLEESIRQFKAFDDKRLTVENLPGYCSQTKLELHGITPEEIKQFIDETGAHFCLDFSHAICGANFYHKDVYQTLQAFTQLKPDMYHLCDGDINSDNDSHLRYEEGNYDLKRLLLDFTTPDALITMETGHGIPLDVQPWIDDINYIHSLLV